MKYIRTKSGIYKVIKTIQGSDTKDLIVDCNGFDLYVVNLPKSEWDYDEDNKLFYEDSMTDSFWKSEAIKESDNIEDLCDLFIIDHIAFPKSKVMFNNIIQTRSFINTKANKPKIKNVFGAIWIEGSEDELILKSVAKMNTEGKLELL